MLRKWKSIQLAVVLAVAGCGAGCSGIRYSRGVSPLDFLLPGLMQNDPSTPGIPQPGAMPAPQLAQAN